MTCNVSKMWNLRMPEGLNLEISNHPMTLKNVVNLIICTERLMPKKSESVRSTELREEHLLSYLLENLVEETFVFECESAPSAQYIKTSEHQCSITDSEQRSLVLVQNCMELHAVMLQGGSDSRKVYINMSTYVHPSPNTDDRPVALAIKDTNLYLSCHKEGDVPTLHLENVEDKSILTTVNPDSDTMRFLFYKQDSGLNISTLRSANFPEWYISTEESDNKPVKMSEKTAQCYRTFTIQHTS